jgi:copper chaperone CopZ
MKATFRSDEIRCNGCASTIQTRLGGRSGIQAVEVDTAGKRVIVEFDPAATSLNILARQLTDAGYPVRDSHLSAT